VALDPGLEIAAPVEGEIELVAVVRDQR